MNEINLFSFHNFLEETVHTVITKTGFPKTVIELGVFQGYFTFNMTKFAIDNNVSDYIHYAIDPYSSSEDIDKKLISEAYDIFEKNLNIFPFSKNIEFLRKKSWDGMIELYNRGVKADLIYVDGDHRAAEVLDDMVLGFKLLRVGGAMICDDSVTWCHTEKNGLKPLQHSPRLAVDAFIHCNWGKIEPLILPNSFQSAFIKRGE